MHFSTHNQASTTHIAYHTSQRTTHANQIDAGTLIVKLFTDMTDVATSSYKFDDESSGAEFQRRNSARQASEISDLGSHESIDDIDDAIDAGIEGEDEDDEISTHDLSHESSRDLLSYASWSLHESMDRDHFFLLPPSPFVGPGPSRCHLSPSLGNIHGGLPRHRNNFVPRSPQIIPSNAVKISPAANETGLNVAVNESEIDRPKSVPVPERKGKNGEEHGSECASTSAKAIMMRNHPSYGKKTSSRTGDNAHTIGTRPAAVADETVSPTGVAMYNSIQSANDAAKRNRASAFREYKQNRVVDASQSSQKLPSSPGSRRPPLSRKDSLTYSVGEISSIGGVSSIGKSPQSHISALPLNDNDRERLPIKNSIYDDDISLLYLDDDCLTECAQPPYTSGNNPFITSEEAYGRSELEPRRKVPALVKWWKAVTAMCHPCDMHRQTVPSRPQAEKPSHNRAKSDPELLAQMLEDRLILVKRSVEPGRSEKGSDLHSDDEASNSLQTSSHSQQIGPPVVVKFRPSAQTTKSVRDFEFQLDQDVSLVVDDSRSLPDEVCMPSL